MKRRGALLGLAFMATSTSTACMGSFLLTRKLYSFNEGLTGNKILNHLVFWALLFVIPLYGVAAWLDLFILNVIEFWTGKNLLADASLEHDDDGTERAWYGGVEARALGPDRVEVRARADGALLAVVERAPSGLVIHTPDRGVIAVSHDEMAAVAAALNQDASG